MIEILLAAFLPPVVLLIASRFAGEDFRRAAIWFAALALLWFSPCWLTGRSPAPFDYLAEDSPPWERSGFRSAAPLLSDVVLQTLPWREAVRDSILHGAMPFLDRYEAAGASLWANPQSGAAFPLTWIGLPFSTFAWPLFASMSKVLIALAGMYLFLRAAPHPRSADPLPARGERVLEERVRRARGLSHDAALIGAVAYGFCAFNIAWLQFPLASVSVFLPFVLLAIETANAPLFAIVLALLILGGHPETVLHCACLAVPYAIAVMIRTRRPFPVVAGGICAVLLVAPVLVPFAKFLPFTERSARIKHDPTILLSPPPNLANLGAFVTVAHLGQRRDPAFVQDFNFCEAATQYAGALTFLLAVAAMIVDARRQRFWIAVFVVAAFLSFESPMARAIVRRVPLANITVHGRFRLLIAFAVAVLAAAAVDRFVKSHGWRVAILLIVFADLAASLMTFNPAVSRQFCYPPALHLDGGRIAAIGNAMRPNSATMLHAEDIGFNNAMTFEPYARLLGRAGYDRRTYFAVFHSMPPRAMLDFLGVRTVVAPPWFTSNALPVIHRGSDAVVFSNPTAKGRVMPLTPGATAVMIRSERNGETIEVRSATPARIATSEVALPGWRVLCGGKAWPMVTLSGAFVGFEAPAGVSRFELVYRPAGFEIGMILFLAGLALWIVLVRRAQ